VLLTIVAMNIFPIGEPTTASGLEYAKASEIKPFSFQSIVISQGVIPKNIFNSLYRLL